MKRAIFKMGRDCTITTHAKDASYEVQIPSSWMKDESEWEMSVKGVRPSSTHGTRIVVSELNASVAKDFEAKSFEKDFCAEIASHYAYIIEKGFQVVVNGKKVKPEPLHLLFAEQMAQHSIQPFIYEATYSGVDVFLAVGFTGSIISSEEAEVSRENYKDQYSSKRSGWTVICNDRTVLYGNKDHRTGWGVSGVPRHHNQFNSISGIAIFSSDDASLLPTTTTKRGIELNNELYMLVRDKMIEGTKLFTQYTNRWKGKKLIAESKKEMKKVAAVELDALMSAAEKLPMKKTRGILVGKQFKPELPRPRQQKTTERISFVRSVNEIKKVSNYLYDKPDVDASKVGEQCFDLMLKESAG